MHEQTDRSMLRGLAACLVAICGATAIPLLAFCGSASLGWCLKTILGWIPKSFLDWLALGLVMLLSFVLLSWVLHIVSTIYSESENLLSGTRTLIALAALLGGFGYFVYLTTRFFLT